MISHRTIHAAALVAFLGAYLLDTTLAAAEAAVVKADQIAVRAEPSAKSERLRGNLKKGDVVLVVGEVADPKAQGNEPRRWAEIEMPPRFPVWVAAELVDPKTGSLKSDKANLRSGPGKNFSRVGQLSKGAKITQVRIQEGWMQIEPPPAAHAFIAADLVDKNPAKPAPAKTSAPRKPTATPLPLPDRTAVAASAQPVPARPLISTDTPTPPPRNTNVRNAVPTPQPVANVPALSAPQPPTSQIPVSTPTAPPLADSSPTVFSKPPTTLSTTNWVATKRRVLREGYLVASMNPKAPSGYCLISKNRSEGLMNYVYTEDARINLKQFQNIFVVVSGEEWIDPTLKATPILIADSVSLE